MFNNKNLFEKSNIAQYICLFYKDFQSYSEEKLKEYNLTIGLYYYLIFIYKKPGSKLNEISKFMNVDKSHTTRAIQKLISYGYVEKQVNEDDKKSFKVYPTEKGKDVMEEMVDLFPRWEERMLNNFSNDEVEALRSLFKKAFKNIVNQGE